MAKVETVGSIPHFLSGEWKKNKKVRELLTLGKVLFASNGALVVMLPKGALAATALATGASTFDNLHLELMKLFDAGVVLVLMFAGAAWALGHRQKSIEIIIGVCCGYLLARHAVDIRDFLKNI